ncbi:VOC family protein [Flavobacterium sp. HTF]|uniref:VOC family protein n=1 Tax=Flavobacterium sp. HTF TaxID=2170732 RepID=UPI000D5FCBDD|nr:VOC family protein [Flavobacterium sp. HTF]PWB26222.1 glyoxalase [Flavobacterium sp. HTF]
METRMIWANLTSEDLEATHKFYTQLGFESNVKHSSDEIASFSFGKDRFIINFFKKERLKDERNGGVGNWENQNEVIFSLSANSREDVDKWCEKVREACGEIFSEPQNYEQSYTCCFSDPDGHKFNFLYWPGM